MQSAPNSSYARPVKAFTAVVLAGGASRRMGSAKALLRFGEETLVERVVGRLKSIASEVIVVSGPHLRLPPLPGVRIVEDDVPLQGPLAGIVYGTRAAGNDIVFVCGCDHPFLEPALVALLAERAASADGAVPIVAGVPQPVFAAYHKRIEPIAAAMLASGERRAVALLEHVRLREVTDAEIAGADPSGRSFLDVDTPEAYRRGLELVERTMTPLRLFVYGTLKRGGRYHDRYCDGVRSIEAASVRGLVYRLPAGHPVLVVPEAAILAHGTVDAAADGLLQPAIVADATDNDASWQDIRGELLTFDDPQTRLPRIDELEGFHPGGASLYRRVLLAVRREAGTRIAAWAYVEGELARGH